MATTPKEIVFEEEAREKLFKGIKEVADVVAFTLGPRGRNVGMEKSWGAPTITNDGASIAQDVEFEGFDNLGVSITKEVVQKIKEKAGDGTTTGTLLLRSLVEQGIKYIASGASPILLKRGMEKAINAVMKEIDTMAKPIKEKSEIESIATVSASGSQEIGKLIADAMEKVGTGGVITIEEAKTLDTTIEVVEGMQFDRGYISPYFCNNAEKMIAEISNVQILLIDKKLNNIHELLPLLQAAAAANQELLIIAEDIEGDVLSTLVVNRLRGTLRVAAVKAPGFGDSRKAMMEDIAIMTGGTVISDETGFNLAEATPDLFGHADKVTLTKDSTTLIAAGHEEAVQERVKQIENEMKNTDNSYEAEKLEERKAKLSGGVAVIHVGAATEPEMKQKKQVTEDSLNSTKAALEEGVVPGGGCALLRAISCLDSLQLEGDEELGCDIVRRALKAPAKQIVNNAGYDGSVVIAELKSEKATMGFNALTGKKEDLLKAGIIDPAKVVKSALEAASSAAGIVLLSEALVIDAKEDES